MKGAKTMENLKMIHLNQQEMFNLLVDLKTGIPRLKTKSINNTFVDWTYFSVDSQSIPNKFFYIVFYKNEELIAQNIVAIAKYGIYGFTGEKHIGFSYVDVKPEYQKQGLATKLITEFANIDFSKFNVEDKKLYISFFSDECLKKGFNNTVKRLFNGLNVVYR